MGKSALGIVFSLLFAIIIMPDATAAGTSNTSAGKKSGAKKTIVAKKKTKSAVDGKRRSAAKKQTTRKRTVRSSLRSNNSKKIVVGNDKQEAGFQRAAYTSVRPAVSPARSAEELARLNLTQAPPALKSNVVLVMDQSNSDVLLEKNAQLAMPIASITKLMTSLVVVESKQDMHQVLTVTEEDIDREKNTYSRLRVGSQLTRANMLHIALMSSENRAASALGRHYPGGMPAFVAAMNAKAAVLGMTNTRFVEPTGLSSNNVASAHDLAKLVVAAAEHPIIRQYSTDSQYAVDPGGATLRYKNSNVLVANPDWEISLQKTGYISEAGRCLVMHAIIEGRPIVMVFLDSKGKLSRLADAGRIRKWLEAAKPPVMSRSAQAVQG
jgi:D-alanyl-D-alanine endopeptidase (penicillin-binding protein 7)